MAENAPCYRYLRALSGPLPGAPVVVLLHGFLGGPDDWSGVASRLSGRFEVVGAALPGHDGVDFPPQLPEDAFSAVSDALMEELRAFAGPRRLFVGGYSMGGRFALNLAIRHGAALAGAVIESAAPGISDPAGRAARAAHDDALAQELVGAVDPAEFRAFLTRWYARAPFDTLSPGQQTALVAKRLENDPGALAAALRQFSVGRQPDLWPELPGLAVPTLVICGERDHKYRQIAEDMAARSPKVAVHVMANAGHNVHFEQPDAYTTVLRGFLEAVV